jgi:hypothetical protein
MTPYSVRLASIDTGAKELTGNLDRLLVTLEKKKFRVKRHQELAEGQVDEWIHEIIHESQTVTKGRNLMTSAKDALKDASQRAQRIPPLSGASPRRSGKNSTWSWAPAKRLRKPRGHWRRSAREFSLSFRVWDKSGPTQKSRKS